MKKGILDDTILIIGKRDEDTRFSVVQKNALSVS
jgi:hypothetical protein